MALVIETNPDAPGVVATERLWLTADRNSVVIEGDPRAAFLFAIPGRSIPRAEAERLGLVAGPKVEPTVPDPEGVVIVTEPGGEPVEIVTTMTNEEAQAAVDAGEAEIPEEAIIAGGREYLETMTFRELQEHCKEIGVSAFGNKETLMKRLRDAMPASDDAEDEAEE